MIRHLGLENEIERDYISKLERGILEPTLDVLLAYARAISTTRRGEFLEAIIDDKLALPAKMLADSQNRERYGGRPHKPRRELRRALERIFGR